ncbi:MAG: hypothetical protein ACO3SP_08410 [Ilumatobacteraceae bacterium]
MVATFLAGFRRSVVFLQNHPRLMIVFSAAVIGFPAVMAVIGLIGERWYPTGDFSHTELIVRSIPQHPPLVGVAARVGDGLLDQGSTPGPSMAYLIYPLYLLGGRSSVGLVAAVVVLHLTAVALSLFVTWRLGGRKASWAMGVSFSMLVGALAPDFFLEPWNVWVPLLAFALFVILIWGIVLGHRWMLLGAVVVGTHCVQTHVSYIPLVAGLLTLAVLVVAKGVSTGEDRALRRWSPLITSAVLLVLLWLPPLIEQLTRSPGNLSRLWNHFADPTESVVGFGAAARAMATVFNLGGPIVGGPGLLPTESPNYWGTLGFMVMVGAGVAAALRSEQRRILALQGVLTLATVIGLLATARIFGYFYEYLIRWMWVLAMLWVAVSIWALVTKIAAGGHRRIVMSIGCVVGAIALVAASSVSATPPLERDSRIVGELSGQLERTLDRSQAYLLRWHDPASLGGTAFGLILAMEKRGIPLFVDAWAGAAAQRHRVREVGDTDAVLCLETGPENIAKFSTRDDVRQLAIFDPRTSDEAKESMELRDAIDAELRRAGRTDLLEALDTQYGQTRVLMDPDLAPQLRRDLQRFNELRLPVAAFVAPQGSLCIP